MDTRTVTGTAPAWSRWGAPNPGRLFSGRWCGRVGGAGRGAAGGFMAALSCLDHLRSVGPLACAWTTCVRLDHLVHEIRWSNGT